ncbi:MAG: hypothetical protein RSD07_12755 [Angelakisella sp.]
MFHGNLRKLIFPPCNLYTAAFQITADAVKGQHRKGDAKPQWYAVPMTFSLQK